MGTVYARNPKPIPASVTEGLESLGFVRRDQPENARPAVWRHQNHPRLVVEVTALSLPGEQEVLVKWNGWQVRRMHPDRALAEVGRLVDLVRKGLVSV